MSLSIGTWGNGNINHRVTRLMTELHDGLITVGIYLLGRSAPCTNCKVHRGYDETRWESYLVRCTVLSPKDGARNVADSEYYLRSKLSLLSGALSADSAELTPAIVERHGLCVSLYEPDAKRKAKQLAIELMAKAREWADGNALVVSSQRREYSAQELEFLAKWVDEP